MKNNPVFHREVSRQRCSFGNAALITVFVGIVAIFALLFFYMISQNVIYSGTVDFNSMLRPYLLIASLEFVLFLLLTPALTAGSISGERERQTLELLLTSKMSPRQIIWGKFASAMNVIGLLFFSSFPVLSLVFVYGGLKLSDLFYLLLNLYVMVIFIGSMSMLFSVLCSRTMVSMIVSYGMEGLLTAGTFAMEWIFYNLRFLKNMDTGAQTGVGGFIGLLTVNPVVTFFSLLERQVGEGEVLKNICDNFGVSAESGLLQNWSAISIAVQLLLSALFLGLAVRLLDPLHGRKKKPKPEGSEA